MLRVPLDEMVLQVLLLGLGRVHEFLAKAIEPPSDAAIRTAINNLTELNALDRDQDLTPLGIPRLTRHAFSFVTTLTNKYQQVSIWHHYLWILA